MAAKRRYDPPNVQLAERLLEARREGLSFEEAWGRAVRPGMPLVMSNTKVVPDGAVRWPTDRFDREAWRAAINASKSGWRRAYDREPPLAREIAIGVIGEAVGALEFVSAQRARAEGIAGDAAILSAA